MTKKLPGNASREGQRHGLDAGRPQPEYGHRPAPQGKVAAVQRRIGGEEVSHRRGRRGRSQVAGRVGDHDDRALRGRRRPGKGGNGQVRADRQALVPGIVRLAPLDHDVVRIAEGDQVVDSGPGGRPPGPPESTPSAIVRRPERERSRLPTTRSPASRMVSPERYSRVVVGGEAAPPFVVVSVTVSVVPGYAFEGASIVGTVRSGTTSTGHHTRVLLLSTASPTALAASATEMSRYEPAGVPAGDHDRRGGGGAVRGAQRRDRPAAQDEIVRAHRGIDGQIEPRRRRPGGPAALVLRRIADGHRHAGADHGGNVGAGDHQIPADCHREAGGSHVVALVGLDHGVSAIGPGDDVMRPGHASGQGQRCRARHSSRPGRAPEPGRLPSSVSPASRTVSADRKNAVVEAAAGAPLSSSWCGRRWRWYRPRAAPWMLPEGRGRRSSRRR